MPCHIPLFYLYCAVSWQVRSENDESEGDAVTYMTVKVSSTDPSHLYASIN